MRAALAALLLAGCAASGGDAALSRLHQAEAQWEYQMQRAEMLVDWCLAGGRDCRAEYAAMDADLDAAERAIQAAERDLEVAERAADRRAASAPALMSLSQQLLAPPRPTVTCTTSNTTIPTTTCY